MFDNTEKDDDEFRIFRDLSPDDQLDVYRTTLVAFYKSHYDGYEDRASQQEGLLSCMLKFAEFSDADKALAEERATIQYMQIMGTDCYFVPESTAPSLH